MSASPADAGRDAAAEASGHPDLSAARKWLLTVSVMVVAVKQVLDYADYAKPAIVVVIAFVVQFIVGMMLMAMFVGTAMIGGMMQSH